MLSKRTLTYPKFDGMEPINFTEVVDMNWKKFYKNAIHGEKRIPHIIENH